MPFQLQANFLAAIVKHDYFLGSVYMTSSVFFKDFCSVGRVHTTVQRDRRFWSPEQREYFAGFYYVTHTSGFLTEGNKHGGELWPLLFYPAWSLGK